MFDFVGDRSSICPAHHRTKSSAESSLILRFIRPDDRFRASISWCFCRSEQDRGRESPSHCQAQSLVRLTVWLMKLSRRYEIQMHSTSVANYCQLQVEWGQTKDGWGQRTMRTEEDEDRGPKKDRGRRRTEEEGGQWTKVHRGRTETKRGQTTNEEEWGQKTHVDRGQTPEDGWGQTTKEEGWGHKKDEDRGSLRTEEDSNLRDSTRWQRCPNRGLLQESKNFAVLLFKKIVKKGRTIMGALEERFSVEEGPHVPRSPVWLGNALIWLEGNECREWNSNQWPLHLVYLLFIRVHSQSHHL